MRKLISLMCAAIVALFSGVEFVLPKDDLFTFNGVSDVGDSYFELDPASSEVSYAGLYAEVYGYEADEVEKCETTPKPDMERKTWDFIIPDDYKGETKLQRTFYDPVDVNAKNDDDSPKVEKELTDDGVKYTLHGELNISAPAYGEINTSHYACNYGKRMQYLITAYSENQYIMTIENAKCWYCCAHKTEPSDGRYTAATGSSLKGQRMDSGDILCVGQEGTTIDIRLTTSG